MMRAACLTDQNITVETLRPYHILSHEKRVRHQVSANELTRRPAYVHHDANKA